VLLGLHPAMPQGLGEVEREKDMQPG
jgi:hypothetical protein